MILMSRVSRPAKMPFGWLLSADHQARESERDSIAQSALFRGPPYTPPNRQPRSQPMPTRRRASQLRQHDRSRKLFEPLQRTETSAID